MSAFVPVVRSTGPALVSGSLVGLAYVCLVVGTQRRVYPGVSLRELCSTARDEPRGVLYAYGGAWLTGTVAATLFLRSGLVLPVGILLLDFLLFRADPHAGDTRGPAVTLLWIIVLPAILLLAGIEYGSLVVVGSLPPIATTVRDLIVGALFVGIVGVGLQAYLPVWRVVPISHTLPIHVENDDDATHRVDVTVIDVSDETPVFTRTIRVEPGERAVVDDAVERLGRYRVVGSLPDGSTDEYVFEPRRRASVTGVVVWIEGELGHLAVIGQGTGP